MLTQIFNLKKPEIKFILISTQRSGTTFLSDLLNSHPDIYMTRELFKTGGDLLNVDSDNYRYFSDQLDVESFLDRFFDKHMLGHHAVGFTIMHNHLLQHPKIIPYTHDNNVKCIYLERSNRLKIAVSRLKARSTGIYHSTTKTPNQPIRIDMEKLMSELEVIDNSIIQLRKLAHKCNALEVLYETLQNNEEKSLEKIQQFLSISFRTNLNSPLQKTNNDDLQIAVENYDELSRRLQSTNYSNYLP
jgi:LPS sulfotransferase NodH